MLRSLSLLASIIVVAACASPIQPEEEPLFAGEITALTTTNPDGRFLVKVHETRTQETSFVVHVSSETEIRLEDGQRVTRDRLVEGSIVSVWASGPIVETLPPQVYADRVVIHRIVPS